MDGSQTILDPPENIGPTSSKATEKKTMNFSFGRSPFCHNFMSTAGSNG